MAGTAGRRLGQSIYEYTTDGSQPTKLLVE
jgi:hypothetical protein